MTTQSTNLMEAHEQWRGRPADQRFETLDALRASVHARRLRSRSIDIDVGKIRVGDEGASGIGAFAVTRDKMEWSIIIQQTGVRNPKTSRIDKRLSVSKPNA